MIINISTGTFLCVKYEEKQRVNVPDVVLATGPGTARQPPHSDAGQSALRGQVVRRARQRVLHHQFRLGGDRRRLVTRHTLVQTAVTLLDVR